MTIGPLAKSLAPSLLLWAFLGLGCEGTTKVIAPAMPPPVSAELLRAAPDTLSLVGFGSVISADLYRDFTPSSPPGNPLTAEITFSLISASDFSSNVTSVYVWVLNSNEVWGAGLKMDDPSQHPHDEVVLIAGDGPPWAPGTQVDVVLGLVIEGRGLQFVKLPSATISTRMIRG